MRIVFDANTLHQSKMGSITGVVYFDFGAEQQFPVAGWSDFVAVVASWWLAALEAFSRAKTEVLLRFMDGPYWITAVAQEGSTVLLRCTVDRRGARVVHEAIVQAAELQEELTSFARAVSNACARACIESPDLDNVRRLLPN